MIIFKKIVVLIWGMLIVFTLTSTTQINIFASSNINGNYEKVANVAVLQYNLNDPYIARVAQYMKDIAKENPNKVKYTFYDSKNNEAVQNEILDSLLKSNYNILMVEPVNLKETAVISIVDKVKPLNIPLIFFGIEPQVAKKVSEDYDKAVFIGLNRDESAIAQGKIIVDLWKNSKDVIDKNGDNILEYVLLRGDVNSPIAAERTKYVISTINDSGTKTNELAVINANWSEELAKNAIESLFLRYGSKIEAIIANADIMAIGAIEGLQKYGYNAGDKSKSIAVVGIDGLTEAIELIDKGFMTGTVIQDPKIYAESIYAITMNVINNVDPLENTNLKAIDNTIIIPVTYQVYTGKPSIS